MVAERARAHARRVRRRAAVCHARLQVGSMGLSVRATDRGMLLDCKAGCFEKTLEYEEPSCSILIA